MFCKKCGKEIGDGEMFCPDCGTPVEKVNQTETAAEIADVQSSVPAGETNVLSEPKKTKKKGKALFAAIVAVVLVLALAITAFASPLVNNFLCKTFMSPEKYLRHVAKKTVKSNSANITNITSIMKNSTVGSGTSYSVKATVGDEIWDLVNQADSEAAAYLNWINDVELKGQLGIDGEKIQSNGDIIVNGSELVKTKMAIDTENEKMYMSLPDIMDKAVLVPVDGMGDVDTRAFMEIFEKIQGIVPDSKAANDIVARYSDCVFSQINKVKKSSDTIEAGGIEQKCTKLTVTITPKTAKNIAKSVLTELKGDKEVRKIVLSAAEAAEQPITEDDYKDAISSALDSIADTDFNFEDFSFNVWANNVGEIVAVGVDEKCIEGFDGEVFAASLKKGNKVGTVIRVDVEGTKVEFEGSAEEKGGKSSGEYLLKAKEMELLKIGVKDQDIKKLEQGLFSGTVTLQLADGVADILSGFDLPSELSALGKLSDMKLEISADQADRSSAKGSLALYSKDNLLAKLEMSCNTNESVKVEIPSDYVDADDLDADINSLGIHFDTIIANLKAAGAPQQITSALELLTAPQTTESDNLLPDGELLPDDDLLNGNLLPEDTDTQLMFP